jgi:galactokinase
MHPEHVAPADDDQVADALADRLPGAVGVFAAPGRVNLIGEHTDYNGGLVLPLALPHATYAAVALRDDELLTVASVQRADRFEIALGDLAPGAVGGWASYVAGVVWALRDAGHEVGGLDVVVDGRVPLGAGLSSSAALVCSVGLAVSEAAGLALAPADLVAPTMRAESEVAGAPTGGMDQTVSLLAEPGHALRIDFTSGEREQVAWDPGSAGLTLLVVDTRAEHALVDGGYASRRSDCEAAADQLGLPSLRLATTADLDRLTGPEAERLRRRTRHVVTEVDRVERVVAALASDDWEGVGRLFSESHASMRDDFEISCAELDVVVETARAHGALGARMTGGGFGGSAIALVRTEDAEQVVAAVGEAFAERGWPAPGVLPAPASAGARRVR